MISSISYQNRFSVVALCLAALTATWSHASTLGLWLAPPFPAYNRQALDGFTNAPGRYHYGSLALEDFNKDGRVDVLQLDGPDDPTDLGLVSYLQGPDGKLSVAQRLLLGTTGYTWHMVTGDFDEDGNPDLIVDETMNDLLFVRGRGDGTFDLPKPLQLGTPFHPTALDVNHDSHLDLIAGASHGPVTVLLGDGKGNFSRKQELALYLQDDQGRGAGSILTGDLNRDGKVDLLVADPEDGAPNWTGTLSVAYGNGDGSFQTPVVTPRAPAFRGALSDFNSDGLLDYAGVRKNPWRFEIWLGAADGKFLRAQSYSFPADFLAYRIFVADLNYDGLPDLTFSGDSAQIYYAGPLQIFLGNGDGSFRPRVRFEPLPKHSVVNVGPRFIDFNRDGYLDIITATVLPPDGGGLAIALHPGPSKLQGVPFGIEVRSENRSPLVLERSDDLATWTPFATNRSPQTLWKVVDPSTPAAGRFYRTKQIPNVP